MILQEDLSNKLTSFAESTRNTFADDIVFQKMANQAKLDSEHCWDINDTSLPKDVPAEQFQEWPNSHCKHVYEENCEDARKHLSGWAMRNTNNHNVHILKKSCLGVLGCTLKCTLDDGNSIHLRPAICDKARRKQLGKPCPNPACNGRLELIPCRGHGGYPVTHFWRHIHNKIYFQAKGDHDHQQPEAKSSAEARRQRYAVKENRLTLLSSRKERKRVIHKGQAQPPFHLVDGDFSSYNGHSDFAPAPKSRRLCTCPPYECFCSEASVHSAPQYDTATNSYTASCSLNANNPQTTRTHQVVPQPNPVFCHYYNNVKEENQTSPQQYYNHGNQQQVQQWHHDNSTVVPQGNYSAIPYNSQYSPGLTTVLHHQEFYQHQNYQRTLTEQYSPSCMYPYYYNSPNSTSNERGGDSCLNSSIASIQTPLNIGVDCLESNNKQKSPNTGAMLLAKDFNTSGGGSSSCEVSPVHNSTIDKQSCRSYTTQLSPSSFDKIDYTKLSPVTTSQHSTSHAHQLQQPQQQTGNYLVNDVDQQQSQYGQSSGIQLPAIASIVDGCDNNGHAQYNAFQNTTIINQQNLIVWCT